VSRAFNAKPLRVHWRGEESGPACGQMPSYYNSISLTANEQGVTCTRCLKVLAAKKWRQLCR
jgi:hypothetical protein